LSNENEFHAGDVAINGGDQRLGSGYARERRAN
jgi:hypothetical protein